MENGAVMGSIYEMDYRELGNLCTHTAKLTDARVCDEAHRIAEVFGNLKEPNSPNKTHFMVELSPAFLLLASSKDTERLQAMLPYKKSDLEV